jgi:tetratricopeptide (TPR) repeat protein
MMRSLWIAITVAMLSAHPPHAAAQPAPTAGERPQPSREQIERARAHFKAAEAAKARGDYKTAVVEYLAAYQLFQDPEFFFNTAEVYRLAGSEPTALTYYEKYLELDPGGRGAEAARAQADQLRRSIAARQDAIRREDQARRQADARRKADEDLRKAETAARSFERPGRSLRLGGLAAGGVGLAALGVGIGFGLKARSINDELTRSAMYDQSRYDEGETAERNMIIFTGIGAAALVTGGILYYVGHRAEQTAGSGTTVTVAPLFAPSQLGLTAAGRF